MIFLLRYILSNFSFFFFLSLKLQMSHGIVEVQQYVLLMAVMIMNLFVHIKDHCAHGILIY